MEKLCKYCQNPLTDNAVFCPTCGKRTDTNRENSEEVVSIWNYIWLTVVFSMPVVGLIISIIMAFAPQKSKSLTNFARAYMIIDIVITVIFAVLLCLTIAYAATFADALTEWINGIIDKLFQMY